MQINDIIFVITLLIPMVLFWWHVIYRWIFLPWRRPDFIMRHWEFWFEKDMVAYSKLVGTRYRFEVSRYGVYKGSLRRVKDSTHFEAGTLEWEVQDAYKKHLDKKFEEIVLE